MKAAYNDGSWESAQGIADWVAGVDGAVVASVERLALGRWGVVIAPEDVRPRRMGGVREFALGERWVLTDHHLVLDERTQPPRFEVLSDEEFHARYVLQVRECPIFSDGEVA